MEEVKTAASYALGSLSVGNLKKYLPFLLKDITANPKRQYLLLHALKEVINSQNSQAKLDETFELQLNNIWNVLVENCNCEEEGIRNVVAECLGKLCMVDAKHFVPQLLVILKFYYFLI